MKFRTHYFVSARFLFWNALVIVAAFIPVTAMTMGWL